MPKRIARRALVSFKHLSMADLQREIERRRRTTGPLMRKRNRLLKQIAKIEAALGEAPVATRSKSIAGSRKRAKNKLTLVEALQKSLRGKTLTVSDAAAAVQKAGYRTQSRTFRVQVNIALIKNPKLFKKIERGHYSAA